MFRADGIRNLIVVGVLRIIINEAEAVLEIFEE
jgi:hypothetical protein